MFYSFLFILLSLIRPRNSRFAFTLIELSIVLVIIGLIIGGVLVGRDLVASSEIRAQISQIEKYNTSLQAFRLKYGYIPGDIPEPHASAYGFAARGIHAGQGDGNGIIQGNTQSQLNYFECCSQTGGETRGFWIDLINANFVANTNNPLLNLPLNFSATVTQQFVPNHFSAAKIGYGNFFYVYSNKGKNYYGVSAIRLVGPSNGQMQSTPSLPVQYAFRIDKKIDDGLPQSGTVTAQYVDYNIFGSIPSPLTGLGWAGSSGIAGDAYTTATPATSTTCFDNGNVIGTQQYSLSIDAGNGKNCALSFQLQ